MNSTSFDPGLTLHLVSGSIAVCQLPPKAEVPDWAWSGSISSVTRTTDELSIICSAGSVPAGVLVEAPWRALMVSGPLEFSLTGVLASLSGTLSKAGVTLFAVSTYDTDYLLVRTTDVEAAVKALVSDGHRVERRPRGSRR